MTTTDHTTATPVTPEPRKTHHLRTALLATGGGFLALAVLGAVLGGGSHTAKPATNPATSATRTGGDPAPAPAATDPAPAPAAADPASPWVTWAASNGLTQFTAVRDDLTTNSTDAGAGNVAAVEADGAKLATDAQTAGSNPPPVDAGDYTTAMTELQLAGNDEAAGDFTGATTHVQAATTALDAFNAAMPATS